MFRFRPDPLNTQKLPAQSGADYPHGYGSSFFASIFLKT